MRFENENKAFAQCRTIDSIFSGDAARVASLLSDSKLAHRLVFAGKENLVMRKESATHSTLIAGLVRDCASLGLERPVPPPSFNICSFCCHSYVDWSRERYGLCRCDEVGYCSTRCCKLDWNRHHRETCQWRLKRQQEKAAKKEAKRARELNVATQCLGLEKGTKEESKMADGLVVVTLEEEESWKAIVAIANYDAASVTARVLAEHRLLELEEENRILTKANDEKMKYVALLSTAREGVPEPPPGDHRVCSLCCYPYEEDEAQGMCACEEVGYCSWKCCKADWRRHHHKTCEWRWKGLYKNAATMAARKARAQAEGTEWVEEDWDYYPLEVVH